MVAAARFYDADLKVSNDKRLRREVASWARKHKGRLRAMSADDLARELLSEDCAAIVAVLASMAARMISPPRTAHEVLGALVVSVASLSDLTRDGVTINGYSPSSEQSRALSRMTDDSREVD